MRTFYYFATWKHDSRYCYYMRNHAYIQPQEKMTDQLILAAAETQKAAIENSVLKVKYREMLKAAIKCMDEITAMQDETQDTTKDETKAEKNIVDLKSVLDRMHSVHGMRCRCNHGPVPCTVRQGVL